MITTRNLGYSYDGKTTLRFPDLQCDTGDQLLILGQSGVGKTTLLHLLGGLLSPREGEIRIDGTDIGKLSLSRLDRFRGKNIGIVFQQTHFLRALTVEENLLVAQRLAGQKGDKVYIENLLEQLNLSHKLKSRTDNLSQGEQQRVAIARALVNAPKVILADEPTSALDDDNCENVIQLLEAVANQVNASLLVVTHDARLKTRFKNHIQLSPFIPIAK